jgi:hypothetical protein
MIPQPFYLQFFNIQYWYCVVYSIFGGKCTVVDSQTSNIVSNGWDTSGVPVNTPAFSSNPDFFSWLLGANGSPVHHTGFFGPVIDGVAFVAGVVIAIISFIWFVYSILAYALSALLVLVIFASLAGLFYIRSEELLLYSTLPPLEKAEHHRGSFWQSHLEDAMSSDPKRWRQGILEADKMLGELLGSLGYQGATTAEKIRQIPENAFVTLPLVWEAHRIKNFVAAPSSDFILTQREAFRVMKLYEQVFEEFNFI